MKCSIFLTSNALQSTEITFSTLILISKIFIKEPKLIFDVNLEVFLMFISQTFITLKLAVNLVSASLFNGISTFVGYLTHSLRVNGIHTFPEGISLKVNVGTHVVYWPLTWQGCQNRKCTCVNNRCIWLRNIRIL